jgi:Family of unknown function (DUF6247)
VAGRIGGVSVSSDAVFRAAATVGRVSAAADIGPVEPGRAPFADASPARVREALTAEDRASFDRQWRALMARATERLDLSEVQEALVGWRQVAWVTSVHGPEVYRRTLTSAQEGLESGERAPGALPWAQLKAERGLPE